MKKLITLTLILVIGLLSALPAQAAHRYDYLIGDALFDDSKAAEGYIYGTWLGAEDKTAYSVKLYRGTKQIMTKRVSDTKIDFSSAIVSKNGGAGKYTFTVTPIKGGDDYKITSDSLDITSTMVTTISKRISAERKAAIAATGGGWTKGPGNIWIYYDQDGEQVKGKWIDYKGHKYHLDKNGIMETGWKEIDKAYYYLEPKGTAEYPMGACWVNATTPDGYKVDETGARLTADGTKEEAKTIKQINIVSLSIKESQEPGKYTMITGISSGVGKVSDIVYLTDPNTWTTESVGVLTCKLTLNDGNILKSNVKTSCSRASSVTVLSKTLMTMDLEIHYIPKYVLESPSNVYINNNYVLHWNKVTKADTYTLKVVIETTEEDADNPGETKTKKETKSFSTTTNAFDLSSNGIGEDTTVTSISIYAVGTNKKKIIDSKATQITDINALVTERMITGEFKQTGLGLQYIDENGEKVTGWKEIGGDWYYFKKNGCAAGPGWYQDPADNNWYYFDKDYHMVTGTITLEDGTYTLNDGTNPNYPKGAWIR